MNDRTNRIKHLLALIGEMAKTDKKRISVEHIPNAKTIKAMKAAEKDKGTVIRSKKEIDKMIDNI